MTENFKKLIESYEILGLTIGQVTFEDIQEAYRDLVKVWHPDRFSLDSKLQLKAQEKMKEINVAYQTIQDASENPGKYNLSDDGFYQEPEEATQQEQWANATPPPPPPNSTPPTPPASNSKKDEQLVRPWVRYWARCLDMLLLGIPSGFLFWLVFPQFSARTYHDGGPYALGFLIVPFIIIMEALVMATFGNTPAKTILRIKVSDAAGKNLSFTAALKRGFYIYTAGLFLGVPLISIVGCLWQYKKLTKKGKTSWDEHFGFNVVHAPIGWIRTTSFVSLFFIILLISVMTGKSAVEEEKQFDQKSVFDTETYTYERPNSADTAPPVDYQLPEGFTLDPPPNSQ